MEIQAPDDLPEGVRAILNAIGIGTVLSGLKPSRPNEIRGLQLFEHQQHTKQLGDHNNISPYQKFKNNELKKKLKNKPKSKNNGSTNINNQWREYLAK